MRFEWNEQKNNWDNDLKTVKVCVCLHAVSNIQVEERYCASTDEDCGEQECCDVVEELEGSVSNEIWSKYTPSLQQERTKQSL
jgi:hypothetical protein